MSENQQGKQFGEYEAKLAEGGMDKPPKPPAKAVLWKTRELVKQMKKDPKGRQGSSILLINPYLKNKVVTNTMDVHIEEIPPLKSPHPAHRHTNEAILFILSGKGYSIIDGERFDWEEGDIIALPSWVWHQHFNTDPVKPAQFIAFKNNPLIENLNLGNREMRPWEE